MTARDILVTSSALSAAGRHLTEGGSVTHGESQIDALVGAVKALEREGIRAVLIGGLAVGVRSGVPRATIDVDLAAPSRTERSQVVKALVESGFTHQGSHEHSENFIHTTGEPVQVALDPEMDDSLDRAEPIAIAAETVFVVTTGDLIAMKERSGKDPGRRRSKALRHLADAALLREGPEDLDAGW